MRTQWLNYWKRMGLVPQFMLAALVILLVSILGLGWWVGQQIEIGVVRRLSAEASLYVDSFLDPPLQELTQGSPLAPEYIAMLDQIVKDTPLGQHVVAFKVWDLSGHILYSTNPALIGQVFPLKSELTQSINGRVVSDISDLTDAENLVERTQWRRLLETYSPITRNGTSDVIAVVEFYQTVDTLDEEIRKAQVSSWQVLGGTALVVFLLLSGFVKRASDTIEHQQAQLSEKIAQLTDLLSQNAELNDRVCRAASRATMLNERFQRRVSAELHDGPVQELGYALLRLDSIQSPSFLPVTVLEDDHPFKKEINDIEMSLQSALQETRAIASGLGMPELDRVSLAEILNLVVHAHERHTGTSVELICERLPDQAPLPSKITLYRLVQEALNNSLRHAGGLGQRVRVQSQEGFLNVVVSDEGMGFDINQIADPGLHLGLSGMRERVESLGGLFSVESRVGQGTRIIARIPLQVADATND